MNKQPRKKCVCGHFKREHSGGIRNYVPTCNACLQMLNPPIYWRHNFKLDNLSYIETLAKERGLV
jgi:hypothetical protein